MGTQVHNHVIVQAQKFTHIKWSVWNVADFEGLQAIICVLRIYFVLVVGLRRGSGQLL